MTLEELPESIGCSGSTYKMSTLFVSLGLRTLLSLSPSPYPPLSIPLSIPSIWCPILQRISTRLMLLTPWQFQGCTFSFLPRGRTQKQVFLKVWVEFLRLVMILPQIPRTSFFLHFCRQISHKASLVSKERN